MKTLVDTFCKNGAGERESGRAGEREKRRLSLSRSVALSLSRSPALPLYLSLFLSVFLAACGKIGDPLPPIPRAPLRVESLSVEQRGAHLILSFPFTRTPKTPLQRIDVYRLLEPLDAPM